MHKLSYFHLSAAVLAYTALLGADARSAELEGALQYPPPSVGEDAQRPPPARTVPQLVTPRRIELGISGSSPPPGTQIPVHHREAPDPPISHLLRDGGDGLVFTHAISSAG